MMRAQPRVGRARHLSARDWAVAALLFAVVCGVYLRSSTRGFLDPKYSLLASQSLLERGSWDLTPYFPGAACDAAQPAAQWRHDAWQLWCVRGRLLYAYPPGATVLSLPLVAALRWSGHSAVGAEGRYDLAGELAIHDRAAAVVTALVVVLVFAAARRELPVWASAVVALVAAWGTTLWSIASQQMWSHTWSALFVAATLLELLRWEEGDERRPALLALLLTAAFWSRPTNAVLAVATTLYVGWRHRGELGKLVGWGALGVGSYVAWSWHLYGTWLPLYVRTAGTTGYVRRLPLEGFAGVFFSPMVGLVVFTPALLVVVAWLVRHGVPAKRRPLALWAAVVVGLAVLPFALRGAWWGGGPRGPRFFTELLPLFAWLGALAWRARRAQPAPARRARLAGSAAAAALVAASLAVQAMTATRFGDPWNAPMSGVRPQPDAPRAVPEKIWDWREAPLVALWRTLTAPPTARSAPPRRRGAP